MPFVSVTRLRVRSWRYLPGFVINLFARHARLSSRMGASRFRSFAMPIVLSGPEQCGVTRRPCALSCAQGVHRRIMARLPVWCDEAALADWVQDATEPPSWSEVYRRLQKEGRRSRVNHPSDAQRRFDICEPLKSSGLVFK